MGIMAARSFAAQFFWGANELINPQLFGIEAPSVARLCRAQLEYSARLRVLGLLPLTWRQHFSERVCTESKRPQTRGSRRIPTSSNRFVLYRCRIYARPSFAAYVRKQQYGQNRFKQTMHSQVDPKINDTIPKWSAAARRRLLPTACRRAGCTLIRPLRSPFDDW